MAHAGYYPKKRIFRSLEASKLKFNFWSCCGGVEIDIRDVLTTGDTCVFKCGCKQVKTSYGDLHPSVELPAYNVYWRILVIYGVVCDRRLNTHQRKMMVVRLIKWIEHNKIED